MSLSTTTITGDELLGRFVKVGDRVLRENTATGESRWSGRIAFFTQPSWPADAENAAVFPTGTRIAWASGRVCLGPIADDDLFVVAHCSLASAA